MPSTDQSTRSLLQALQGVLSQVAEPIQVLRTILDQAVQQVGADRGVFVEVTGSGELRYEVLHKFDRSDLTGESGGYSRSIFERVLRTGEPVILQSAAGDANLSIQKSVKLIGLSSVLCMPIRVGGQIAALVHLENRRPGYFQESHRDLLSSLLDVAEPVLEALRVGRQVLSDKSRLEMSERRFREEAEESRDVLARESSFGRFVGRSEAIHELGSIVKKAATADFPVLLLGETGTGKSIVARVLHHAGPRSKQTFATVFCPSLERGMVEAELFGHRKGAFTGAQENRIGKVQAAHQGTLFLDELGELPLELQPKLLRLLQEKTYERVGDAEERTADVRVIGATNRDLEQEVEAGRFRRDLFERLNFIPIRIPPLRERREDIPLILRHCLDRHEAGRWIELSDEARDFLVQLDFAWPGNVRHLEQLAARLTLRGERAVGKAALLQCLDTRPTEDASARRGAAAVSAGSSDGSGVRADAGVRPDSGAGAASARESDQALEMGLPLLLEEAEKVWLAEALRRYPKLTRAELAAKLKISPAALYKKLREYELGG